MYTSKYLNRCQFRKQNGSQCKRLGRVLCSNNGSYEYYCKQHATLLKGEGFRIERPIKGFMTGAGPYERFNNVQAPNVADAKSIGGVKKVEDIELTRVLEHYQNNIGMITPLIGEALKDALSHYPADRIIEAIDIAGKANKKSWAYVNLILLRWRTNGKNELKK